MNRLTPLRAANVLVNRLMLGVALLAFTGLASAGVVNLTSSASSVAVGDLFTLRIKIDGLTAAVGDSLSGFDLKFSFDSTAAAYQGASFVDAASATNQLMLPEASAFPFQGDVSPIGMSTLNGFALSGNSDAVLDAEQADEFVFLSLTFKALAETAAARFGIDVSDPDLLFTDAAGGLFQVSFGTPALAVQIVQGGGGQVLPEPPMLALTGLALLLTTCGRRRRLAGALSGLALSLTGLVTPAHAQTAPVVTASAGVAVEGRVVEVRGQRLKLRNAAGVETWYTVTAPISAGLLNKLARGQARPVGDSMLLDGPRFD